MCGGETLPADLARALLDRVDELWNLYGPTETTIWSTVDRVTEGPITVGRPIANTQIYVVDRSGDVVPVGVAGEIWIGGDGVAAGYHHRPELTEATLRSGSLQRAAPERVCTEPATSGDGEPMDGCTIWVAWIIRSRSAGSGRIGRDRIRAWTASRDSRGRRPRDIRSIPGQQRLIAYLVVNETDAGCRRIARAPSETASRLHGAGRVRVARSAAADRTTAKSIAKPCLRRQSARRARSEGYAAPITDNREGCGANLRRGARICHLSDCMTTSSNLAVIPFWPREPWPDCANGSRSTSP